MTALTGFLDLIDRAGLRRPFHAALRTGTRVTLQASRSLARAIRLPRAATTDDGFDLTPTDEQAAMQAATRAFAAAVLRPAARAADAAAAPPADVLARGHELALAALSVPAAFGGLAEQRSPVTSCLVAEELARGDLGLAVALLAPLGVVNALIDGGTAEQQQRWLPRFTGPAFVPAAIALLEPHAGADPMQPRTGAVRCDGGWRLYGTKALVPLARDAELLLVAANVLGRLPQLFVVERATPGLAIVPEPAMGLRAAATCRVTLDDVRVPDASRVEVDHAALVDGARLLWCALACGACQAALDYVIPYCNERFAFGEPISHRQSIAFAIANIAIELDGMRLATWRAAARAERGLPFAREAALAHRLCAGHAAQIGSTAVQLLGGHGYVVEHPVERWYRDLRAIGVMEGALLP